VQLQPGGLQGRPALIGQRTADGVTVAADGLRLGIGASFPFPLDRPHPADPFLQFLLGVTVGLVEGSGRLTQLVELAELIGHSGQSLGHGLADGVLSIGDHPGDGDREVVLDLTEQSGPILLSA